MKTMYVTSYLTSLFFFFHTKNKTYKSMKMFVWLSNVCGSSEKKKYLEYVQVLAHVSWKPNQAFLTTFWLSLSLSCRQSVFKLCTWFPSVSAKPISKNLRTNYPWMREFHVCSTEETYILRGDNLERAKIGRVHLKTFRRITNAKKWYLHGSFLT